jgi:hypothetical protein
MPHLEGPNSLKGLWFRTMLERGSKQGALPLVSLEVRASRGNDPLWEEDRNWQNAPGRAGRSAFLSSGRDRIKSSISLLGRSSCRTFVLWDHSVEATPGLLVQLRSTWTRAVMENTAQGCAPGCRLSCAAPFFQGYGCPWAYTMMGLNIQMGLPDSLGPYSICFVAFLV